MKCDQALNAGDKLFANNRLCRIGVMRMHACVLVGWGPTAPEIKIYLNRIIMDDTFILPQNFNVGGLNKQNHQN